MTAINPARDVELIRQTKNHTESQKKNADATKEGVVVNSFYKEPKSVNMDELYDSLVISDNAKMPTKLHEKNNSKERSIIPISLISTGVMAAIALTSLLIKRSSKINLKIAHEKQLDYLTRNVSITNESVQGLYQMIQCPNQKTILAGTGVIALGAMAFMGKMFIDGFKEIWVKKREADIQKNLQENLVAVETQSFSGKIQITRSMLAEKAREFNDYLCTKRQTPPVFQRFDSNLKFMGNKKNNDESQDNNKSSNLKYLGLGLLTLGSIVGLGALSLKNLSKGKKHLEEYIKLSKEEISKIISRSSDKTKTSDKVLLQNKFQSIDSSPEYINEALTNLKWKDSEEKNNFINEVVSKTKKSTTKADFAIGGNGTPKPAFNSYVDNYRAFFYNYLLDTENPQFKMLFYGVTGLSAFAYGGKSLGEAVKEVQVKKINAQTELDLQQRLVSTELRNFKAKKDAAIDPLREEFYVQLQKGKPKEELKTIAENILFEVKNGPPFVYS